MSTKALTELFAHPSGRAVWEVLQGDGRSLDLTAFSFSGLELKNLDLSRHKITGRQLAGVISFENCNLTGINMRGFVQGYSLTLVDMDLSGCRNLKGNQLSGMRNISGCNFGSMDMTGFSVAADATIRDTDFSNTRNLNGKAFRWCGTMSNVVFGEQKLKGFWGFGVSFYRVDFGKCIGLNGSQLNGAKTLSDCRLPNTIGFSAKGMSLAGMDFSGAALKGCQLNGADCLHRVNLKGIDMTGYTAEGQSVREVNFSECQNFTGEQLNGARSISGVGLDGVEMSRFSAKGVSISDMDFSNIPGFKATALNGAESIHRVNLDMDMTGFDGGGIDFKKVDFRGCQNLSGHQLSGATSLNRCNLGTMDMKGAVLTNAKCELTRFTHCTNLTVAQVRSLKITPYWKPYLPKHLKATLTPASDDDFLRSIQIAPVNVPLRLPTEPLLNKRESGGRER